MKKIFCLISLFLCLMSISVSAADAPRLTVDGKSSAKIGEEIVFSVVFEEEVSIYSMAIIPEYDENIFSLVSGRWLIPGFLSDFSVTEGNGVLALEESQGFSGLILEFTLIAKAETDVTAVSCECVMIDEWGGRQEASVSGKNLSVSLASPQSEATEAESEPIQTMTWELSQSSETAAAQEIEGAGSTFLFWMILLVFLLIVAMAILIIYRKKK